MTDSEHVPHDELKRTRGEPLPHREAMSLVSPDPTFGDTAAAGMFPTTADAGPAAGAAGLASGAANDFTPDADASAHDTETVTDADRSETFSSSDSASAS